MTPKLGIHPEALAPEIRVHTTPSINIGHEIATLARVVEVGALEASLFYCGRILEGLAASSVDRLGLPVAELVFNNLVILQEVGQLRGPVTLFAHALRRYGNDARHLRRQIQPADAEVALGLVTRWLGWYFCESAFGPGLPALTPQGAGPFLASPHRVHDFLDAAEKGVEPATDSSGLWLSQTPVCVTIRQLIDSDRLESAAALLTEAKARFPGDLLLQQLNGLLLSRSGRLEEALEVLEPLARVRFDEEETSGILAGVHKRLWSDRGRSESLDKARRIYARGWTKSGHRNTYLGINAATLALMDGDAALAQQTAAQLARQILDRREDMERRWGEKAPAHDPWERATLAEAFLIQQKIPEAREQYTLVRSTLSAGGWRSASRQAGLILQKLGLHSEGDFLEQR
jgi:tetratricopeptide (TPR) repeat protein